MLSAYGFDPFMGLKVIQTPSWAYKTERHWRALPLGQIPAGTSPRTHSRRRQWMVGYDVRIPIEPDHVIRMHDTIICTPTQYSALKRAMRPANIREYA